MNQPKLIVKELDLLSWPKKSKRFGELHGPVFYPLTRLPVFYPHGRSFAGIEELSRSLYLETPKNRVHMMVLTARLGKRAQVAKGGYMEAHLAPHYSHFSITPRMDEDNNLRLEIVNFTGPFEIAPEIRPLANDWTVTGRGAVIARFTWEALNWDAAVEAGIMAYSERVVALLEASC